ncbi:hypothetical protein C8A00DRAFT_39190 [Chaetomidium leptoderma]|uniref:BZIP domain-containing protein n=1 Tax=Chaetomidium leptoderma TaxID=669021 RepID=A0AAN7A208_9PEZI|nr:hypothetical protein C8A00DRAFT_39190 [Chaetomidium leptoderma]
MRSKAKLKNVEGAEDAVSGDPSADKTQARRAQVRKAQTQHRQRKANYVKQLEMDVARVRDMIEAAERDTQAMLDENKAMRAQIQQALHNKSRPLSLNQGVSLIKALPQPCQLSTIARESTPPEPEGVTVTLGFDEVMNAPTFYISSPPSSTHSHQPYESSQETSPTTPDTLPDLTPAQTQAAINFILALEHICRSHFHPSLYHPPPPDTVYSTPLIGHQANGHTLMATSIALRNAPPHIFKAASRSSFSRLFPGGGGSSSSSLPALRPAVGRTGTETETGSESTATPKNDGNDDGNDDGSSSAEGGGGGDERGGGGGLSWKTSSLTLRALHGLASSLSPDDRVEITPVQAWFELVGRFGVDVLMAEGVLERLRREFVGVVRCPHYGASLERGSFESVVARVLGGGDITATYF